MVLHYRNGQAQWRSKFGLSRKQEQAEAKRQQVLEKEQQALQKAQAAAKAEQKKQAYYKNLTGIAFK